MLWTDKASIVERIAVFTSIIIRVIFKVTPNYNKSNLILLKIGKDSTLVYSLVVPSDL